MTELEKLIQNTKEEKTSRELAAYWIQKKVPDNSYVSGYKLFPQSTCSNCGGEVNIQKPVCPYCGAKMTKGDD